MNIEIGGGHAVPLKKIRSDFEQAEYVGSRFARVVVLALCRKVEELAARVPALRTYGQQLRGDPPTPYEEVSQEVERLKEELRESRACHDNLKHIYSDAEEECRVLREFVEHVNIACEELAERSGGGS